MFFPLAYVMLDFVDFEKETNFPIPIPSDGNGIVIQLKMIMT